MQKESLVSIRVRTADPSWFCIFHYSLYTAQGIKAPFEKKLQASLTKAWSPCVILSLSLSFSIRLFFRLIPWSAEALWVHFPARTSKTLSRRCSAPSPHREGVWVLHEQSKPRAGALLAFWVNQGISTSSSQHSFSLSLSPNCCCGYRISRTCVHCWWECKMVQLLWKKVWQFLTKCINVTTTLLVTYTKKLKT